MHTILVLGGYGFFGSRICEAIAPDANIRLLIGGRNAAQAQAAASSLGLSATQGIAIDAHGTELAQRLTELQVDTVIHTAGPFQGQDYSVARAAISAPVCTTSIWPMGATLLAASWNSMRLRANVACW